MNLDTQSSSSDGSASSQDSVGDPLTYLFPNNSYRKDFIHGEQLGQGGYGKVFKVQNKIDRSFYAVKRIKFNSLDAKDKIRALNEILILTRLNHKNIVRYFRAWMEDCCLQEDTTSQDSQVVFDAELMSANMEIEYKYLFIQLELCEGFTLRDLLLKERLDTETAISFTHQLIDGLSYLQEEEIIHSDLKPANILLGQTMPNSNPAKLKISDFGLAIDKRRVDENASCPTLMDADRERKVVDMDGDIDPYMSPELHGGKTPDHKADIYSAGVILMELFFHFKTDMERFAEAKALRKGQVPICMKDCVKNNAVQLILKMTRTQPCERPDAQSILSAIRVHNLVLALEELQLVRSCQLADTDRSSFHDASETMMDFGQLSSEGVQFQTEAFVEAFECSVEDVEKLDQDKLPEIDTDEVMDE